MYAVVSGKEDRLACVRQGRSSFLVAYASVKWVQAVHR